MYLQEALQSLAVVNTLKSSKAIARKVPQVPERILDAPDIINDYYLNPLDWSPDNILAVALANHVYLWNANTGEVNSLTRLNGLEDYVSAVKWVKEQNVLAVGQSNGDVALWDVGAMKKLRTLKGHTDRASSLSWNEVLVNFVKKLRILFKTFLKCRSIFCQVAAGREKSSTATFGVQIM